MTNPETQKPEPDALSAEVSQQEWESPHLMKLPITDTAVAGQGSINDGFTFSS